MGFCDNETDKRSYRINNETDSSIRQLAFTRIILQPGDDISKSGTAKETMLREHTTIVGGERKHFD